MNICIICGCTDLAACVSVDGEPCHWALDTADGPVCSACVLTPIAISPPAISERLPLAPPLQLRVIDDAVECDCCGGDGCLQCWWSGVTAEEHEAFA